MRKRVAYGGPLVFYIRRSNIAAFELKERFDLQILLVPILFVELPGIINSRMLKSAGFNESALQLFLFEQPIKRNAH